MRHARISKWILYATIIFWFFETAYFGWNLHAMSQAEKNCDDIVSVSFSIAMVIYLLPGFKRYHEWLKEN